jgi:hypothetical protein
MWIKSHPPSTSGILYALLQTKRTPHGPVHVSLSVAFSACHHQDSPLGTNASTSSEAIRGFQSQALTPPPRGGGCPTVRLLPAGLSHFGALPMRFAPRSLQTLPPSLSRPPGLYITNLPPLLLPTACPPETGLSKPIVCPRLAWIHIGFHHPVLDYPGLATYGTAPRGFAINRAGTLTGFPYQDCSKPDLSPPGLHKPGLSRGLNPCACCSHGFVPPQA